MLGTRTRGLLVMAIFVAMLASGCVAKVEAVSHSDDLELDPAIIEASYLAAQVDFRFGNAVDTTTLVPGDCFKPISEISPGVDVHEVVLLSCDNTDAQYSVAKLQWQTDSSYPGDIGFSKRATCGFGPREYLAPSQHEWEVEIWRNIICLKALDRE